MLWENPKRTLTKDKHIVMICGNVGQPYEPTLNWSEIIEEDLLILGIRAQGFNRNRLVELCCHLEIHTCITASGLLLLK